MTSITNKDIIEKWKAGLPIDWRTLTTDEKREWLLACLTRDFQKGQYRLRITIDGREINSSVDLYCLLGQIFFGDKGYFGQGLDGLDDCFCDLTVLPETTLIIKNHEGLANVLNKKIDTYFTMLIDIFKEHGLRIRPGSVPMHSPSRDD